MKFGELNERNEVKSYLQKMAKKTDNEGGNAENLLSSLDSLAVMLDNYNALSKNPGNYDEQIYTKKTLELFKKLVDSMADDEIRNNNISDEL